MKIERDTVYISADKLTTTDKDGKVKVLYAFPSPLPEGIVLKDGKYFIPVKYVDPEVGDVTFSEEYAAELPSDIPEADLVAACKAGIRLLLGDAAKEAFRVGGNGVKAQAAALSWACQPANLAHFEKWQATVKTSGKAAADAALLAAYNAR